MEPTARQALRTALLARRGPATSLRQAAQRGLVRGIIVFACFAASFLVMGGSGPIDMVFPESGSSARTQDEASKVQQAYTEAMGQCEALPANTLPGAVVIDYTGQLPRYTAKHKHVDAGFSHALGQADPRIEGVTLCK